MQEQMTFPKEANGRSQDPGYNTALEAIVQFGQMSHLSQSLAVSIFAQDAGDQDAPEAMPQIDGRTMTAEPFWTVSQNKVAKIGDHERTIMKDRNAIMQQEVWANDIECDMAATQLSEYGANNPLLPPLAGPLPRPSTPVRVSEPMDEAPETPKTGNVIQPLVKKSVPPQVTQLSTFARSRLTQSDPLITFNSKKCVDPAPMKFQHRTVKQKLYALSIIKKYKMWLLNHKINVSTTVYKDQYFCGGKKGLPRMFVCL
jgi:hypothetical protein